MVWLRGAESLRDQPAWERCLCWLALGSPWGTLSREMMRSECHLQGLQSPDSRTALRGCHGALRCSVCRPSCPGDRALCKDRAWLSSISVGLRGDAGGKEPACQCVKDVSLILGSGRSLGGRHGNPLQYSCLENPMGRGAWRAAVHRTPKSQT